MERARRALLVGAAALLLVLAAIAAFLFLRERPALPVLLAAEVDAATRVELESALAEYNGLQRRYAASLLPAEAAGEAELLLGPYAGKGIVWRSQGWRLWARLETLAGLEGELQRPLIKSLREGKLDGAELEALLPKLGSSRRAALALPAKPESYARALGFYLERLGWKAGERLAEWKGRGLLRAYPDQEAAFAALRRGEAVFILGNDAVGPRLGSSSDFHAEAFPLPGGSGSGSSWALGRADAFTLPPRDKTPPGALDLLAYLTSKGLARRFAERLPGAYYSWVLQPEKGELPLVEAPAELLDPER